MGHSVCGKTTRVSSSKNDTTAAKPPESAPKRKRISPSRARRNARRLQAFLNRKKQDLLQSVDSHVSQREFEHADNLVVASATDDKDLKSYIDKEVSCVDFLIDNGEPGLELELNSGEYVWAPVCVKKPGDHHSATDQHMSVKDLGDMDEIIFQTHEVDDNPGVVLRKGSLEVWTPVASRTRSRLRHSRDSDYSIYKFT